LGRRRASHIKVERERSFAACQEPI
jgi:protein tyrosine phosphatase